MIPVVIYVALSALVIALVGEVFRWRRKFFDARKESAELFIACDAHTRDCKKLEELLVKSDVRCRRAELQVQSASTNSDSARAVAVLTALTELQLPTAKSIVTGSLNQLHEIYNVVCASKPRRKKPAKRKAVKS